MGGDLGVCWNNWKKVAKDGVKLDWTKFDQNKDGKVSDTEWKGDVRTFDFFDESREERAIDLGTVHQLKAKVSATEKALSKVKMKRAHKIAFDMSLAADGKSEL